MDEIQRILVKAGRKDLAQKYYQKVANAEVKSQLFEITDAKNMSVSEATKVIDEYYHDKLTYKGHEFFDRVYMQKIVPFASNELGIGKTWTDKKTWEEERIEGQESYLGYLPDRGVFVSGWDMFGEAEDLCVVFLRVDRNLNVTLVEESKSYYGMMYPDNFRKLHADFPTLVDIRLD